jgi:hypothetical protein
MGLTEPLSDGVSAGPMVAKLTDPLEAVDGLLERTQTFRDHVQSSGGSIEDGALGNLYDPILRKVKKWGLLSELVFFGAGSAIKVNSGSIPKLYDGSGNENDPTQSNTSNQPTLQKDSIGGRWGGDYDGSNDFLHTDLSSAVSRPHTLISVVKADVAENIQATQYHSDPTSANSDIFYMNNTNYRLWGGGSGISGIPSDKNPHLLSGWLDGSGNGKFWVDGTSQGTGSSLGSYSASGVTLSRKDYFWNGEKVLDILFGPVQLSESQISELEKIINNYYLIY